MNKMKNDYRKKAKSKVFAFRIDALTYETLKKFNFINFSLFLRDALERKLEELTLVRSKGPRT